MAAAWERSVIKHAGQGMRGSGAGRGCEMENSQGPGTPIGVVNERNGLVTSIEDGDHLC
jgi:hypothetical protein